MALKGNLSDLSVADLIQLHCQAGARARLQVTRADNAIINVFFEGGEVVHADWGAQHGDEVVYELLTWEVGTFAVEQDMAAPERTIRLPWSALIIEGMRRFDEKHEAAQQASLAQDQDEEEQIEMAEETRRDRLAKILRNLIDTSGDVSGVAIVSMDGLIMAADLPASVEQARVGAVAAAILSLSGRSVGQLKRGTLQQTTVQGTEGYIVLTQAGPNAVLVALTGQNVNLGMVFLEIRECAVAVAAALG